jgi:hypothetical protein
MQASRHPKEYWTNHINAWKASGLTQANYCNLNKDSITLNQLTYQNSKRSPSKKDTPEKPSSAFATIAVPSHHSENSGGLTLHLPNGIHLSGIDATTIDIAKQLLVALS